MTYNYCSDCIYDNVLGSEQPCVNCHEDGTKFVAKPQYYPTSVPLNHGNGSFWVSKDGVTNMSITTPQTEGKKYDSGKPDWSLLPFKAVSETVEVLTFGANKYGPENWRIVPNAKKRYLAAAFRHIVAYATGEKKDSESGLSHLSHALCCLMFILELEKADDTSNS